MSFSELVKLILENGKRIATFQDDDDDTQSVISCEFAQYLSEGLARRETARFVGEGGFANSGALAHRIAHRLIEFGIIIATLAQEGKIVLPIDQNESESGDASGIDPTIEGIAQLLREVLSDDDEETPSPAPNEDAPTIDLGQTEFTSIGDLIARLEMLAKKELDDDKPNS